MGFKKERKFGAAPKSFTPRAPRFGSKPAFGKRDSPHSVEKTGNFSKNKFELFDTVCEKCGNDCQVPFKPTSGKPVYCRNCFNKNDEFVPRKNSSGTADLDEINRKLDKIMRALKIN